MFECPNNSCTILRSASPSKRCVANECLKLCAEILEFKFNSFTLFLIIKCTYCRVQRRPKRFTKKYETFFTSQTLRMEYEDIGITRSLSPLPLTFKIPSPNVHHSILTHKAHLHANHKNIIQLISFYYIGRSDCLEKMKKLFLPHPPTNRQADV